MACIYAAQPPRKMTCICAAPAQPPRKMACIYAAPTHHRLPILNNVIVATVNLNENRLSEIRLNKKFLAPPTQRQNELVDDDGPQSQTYSRASTTCNRTDGTQLTMSIDELQQELELLERPSASST